MYFIRIQRLRQHTSNILGSLCDMCDSFGKMFPETMKSSACKYVNTPVIFSVVSVTLSTSAAGGHDAGACSPKSGVAAKATATESAAATWAATGSSAACNLGEDFADLLPDLRFFACVCVRVCVHQLYMRI